METLRSLIEQLPIIDFKELKIEEGDKIRLIYGEMGLSGRIEIDMIRFEEDEIMLKFSEGDMNYYDLYSIRSDIIEDYQTKFGKIDTENKEDMRKVIVFEAMSKSDWIGRTIHGFIERFACEYIYDNKNGTFRIKI